MLFKRKYISVVIFSCLIIAVVFISTIAGYSLYIQWKEDSLALAYRKSIFEITGQIFRDRILISNVRARIPSSGPMAGLPMLEGEIKNTTDKTISSVLLEVSFVKKNGKVLYKDRVYPLDENDGRQHAYISGTKTTGALLKPQGYLEFRHLMRNCPQEVLDHLSVKENFARSAGEDRIVLEYKIKGIRTI
ncbi:MAG: hypothetical protein GF408_02270 [Candidatus Omnitrophica bacterium]|nr:hypothetical protein [Candidatus Omnitrophota bacterium]